MFDCGKAINGYMCEYIHDFLSLKRRWWWWQWRDVGRHRWQHASSSTIMEKIRSILKRFETIVEWFVACWLINSTSCSVVNSRERMNGLHLHRSISSIKFIPICKITGMLVPRPSPTKTKNQAWDDDIQILAAREDDDQHVPKLAQTLKRIHFHSFFVHCQVQIKFSLLKIQFRRFGQIQIWLIHIKRVTNQTTE